MRTNSVTKADAVNKPVKARLDLMRAHGPMQAQPCWRMVDTVSRNSLSEDSMFMRSIPPVSKHPEPQRRPRVSPYRPRRRQLVPPDLQSSSGGRDPTAHSLNLICRVRSACLPEFSHFNHLAS